MQNREQGKPVAASSNWPATSAMGLPARSGRIFFAGNARHMTGKPTLEELDEDIAKVRANLRDLIEQETARSGAADDARSDALIAQEEDLLARLIEQRKALVG